MSFILPSRCPFVKKLTKAAFVLVNPQHSFIHCLTHKIYDTPGECSSENSPCQKVYIMEGTLLAMPDIYNFFPSLCHQFWKWWFWAPQCCFDWRIHISYLHVHLTADLKKNHIYKWCWQVKKMVNTHSNICSSIKDIFFLEKRKRLKVLNSGGYIPTYTEH